MFVESAWCWKSCWKFWNESQGDKAVFESAVFELFWGEGLAQMFLSPVNRWDKLLCKGSQVFLQLGVLSCMSSLCLGPSRFNASSGNSRRGWRFPPSLQRWRETPAELVPWHCQFSPLLKTDLVHFLTVDMLKNLSTVDVKQRGFFSQQGLSCYKSITWIIMGCEREGHCLFFKILCFLTIYIMYFLIFACAMC